MLLNIKKITAREAPYDLLYDADPSREAVADYLSRGECYAAFIDGIPIPAGVCVLLRTRPFTMEIVNIAVDETFRRRGIAKKMIACCMERAREAGCGVLEVGTGNSGMAQLALYQKCGFSITSVDIDFFRKHYQEPIFENGIECRHMIRLSMEL